MGVPEAVQKVARPKNTVVIDYGEGHGNLRFAISRKAIHSQSTAESSGTSSTALLCRLCL